MGYNLLFFNHLNKSEIRFIIHLYRIECPQQLYLFIKFNFIILLNRLAFQNYFLIIT